MILSGVQPQIAATMRRMHLLDDVAHNRLRLTRRTDPLPDFLDHVVHRIRHEIPPVLTFGQGMTVRQEESSVIGELAQLWKTVSGC